MRPLGHTEAREERDARIPSDDRLRKAWEGYVREASSRRAIFDMELATSYLIPRTLSVERLHHFILATPHDEGDAEVSLGIFVSAGYNLLPDEEIRYPLTTPSLRYLGYRLRHKHLIIDGELGSSPGAEMTGQLTINGSVGSHAGYRMVGTLVKNGETGRLLGMEMLGILMSGSDVSCGAGMLGVRNGYWISDGSYTVAPERCERFKKSLAHALTLPDDEIRSYLEDRYRYGGKHYAWYR